jgi:hypothetical protein
VSEEFAEWMKAQPNVDHVGKVVVFYVPSKKLDSKIREMLHDFFVSNYSAYTHELGEIKGYWVSKDTMFKDEHERFEVSFGGTDNFKKFVSFISEICRMAGEDCIYVTVGEECYLVRP